ncbi:MAG: PQQ-dependent dehydrogenase, methanol/ethanol family [Vicinamibacterales bacterium]
MRTVRLLVAFALASALTWATLDARQRAAPPPPPAPPLPMPAILRTYPAVTAERLLRPGDADWLSIRRTYDGWGYSPLDQITPANIARLRPVWIGSTGATNGHEAPALVNGGVMFVATPGNQVIALEAATGRVLWRYRRAIPEDAVVMHPTSRGVALYGDKVYLPANEGVLVALDARTGKEVWTADVGGNTSGYYMTLAPLVAEGKVMIGASGGEFGIRGFVAAFDAEAGTPAWKTYTVPAPGEPGSETWPKGEQWKTGGAPVWVTGNYDPESRLAYWGTGNGGPWMGDQRPGDNLYTASTIAVDVATGAIKGHFQYHPNDSWDWDEVSPPILVDYRRGARTVRGLVNVARDGYLWFLERGATGPIGFVEGTPYVRQTVFRSLDPKTGRPDVDPARKPGTGKKVENICPSHWGGKNWPPIAFSPKTRMIYIPANENLCDWLTGTEVDYEPGERFIGATSGMRIYEGATHIGEVQAWNVDTGKRVWTHEYPTSPTWGSMLATGGGLVFTGGTNDRKLHAFDAATGALVWEFPTNSGILSPPSSFSIDGKQYIAVQSGWGIDSRGMQSRLNTLTNGAYPEVPEGGAIWVFALP